jgi:hypothetical protein
VLIDDLLWCAAALKRARTTAYRAASSRQPFSPAGRFCARFHADGASRISLVRVTRTLLRNETFFIILYFSIIPTVARST